MPDSAGFPFQPPGPHWVDQSTATTSYAVSDPNSVYLGFIASRTVVYTLTLLAPEWVSQLAVEVLDRGTPVALTSQLAVETLRSYTGATVNAGVSQDAVEVLRSIGNFRVSQDAVEVAISSQGNARVSQDAIEVATAGQGNARVSQDAVEVALSAHGSTSAGLSQLSVEVAVSLPPRTVTLPFIASKTRVYGIYSLFVNGIYSGPGNGGERFPLKIAPNGTAPSATLAASIPNTGVSLLTLTGDGGLPTSGQYVLQVDAEVIWVQPQGGGTYRIFGRAMSNTAATTHNAGATVTWHDHYDMPIIATQKIGASFTADILSSGSFTYEGWLISFDSTQAYLGSSRYPMRVTELLGVFDPGAGAGGVNRCDAVQPTVVGSAFALSDNCPVGLTNPSRIAFDIIPGDVALVRYTNPEAATMTLGSRAAALTSWFGLMRVSNTNADVTLTLTTGHVVDTTGGYGTYTAAVEDEFLNPLFIGIGPDTGAPTPAPVAFTTKLMPGADRWFTYGPPGYGRRGWPMGAVAVRQGQRRVPYWRAYDWRDYNYVYTGFAPDATFAQQVINRNGILLHEPSVELPGPQDIQGPNAVWDDNSYYFAVAWYIAIYNAPYLVVGPAIGGSGSSSGSTSGYVPTVTFPAGGGTPSITPPPVVEGGGGGGQIGGPVPTGAHVAVVFP